MKAGLLFAVRGVQDAKYTVVVPVADALGNPLVNVAQHAHQYMTEATKGHSWIEPGKTGGGQTSHLVTVTEETPEVDSVVKQLAAYVGEVCNVPSVHCLKEGKNGIVRWEIANPEFRRGQPAEQLALAGVHLP